MNFTEKEMQQIIYCLIFELPIPDSLKAKALSMYLEDNKE